ncbi:hypothetical protein IMG5_188670 [Ichthyophthirius multifiliis]|uniref:Uncharacterized protein n=1 Tax=Ichthyophthirius multifiliis TaxID=5932 RepID=G0R400_ICHMU|nr:hypothetical protein IMG5_188670 [Ichthyophthirius multifiliis]EGR27797.1 hypothetical protein IMG5_188670 [Ichthyophthirius multifiliis]|eukprot:XP_004027142.1 hypothetical protein IMG5_188670 [Ichthyophthirius multifiliis]
MLRYIFLYQKKQDEQLQISRTDNLEFQKLAEEKKKYRYYKGKGINSKENNYQGKVTPQLLDCLINLAINHRNKILIKQYD